jgi:hypothetical protein
MIDLLVASLVLSHPSERPPIMVEAGSTTYLGRTLCAVSGDKRIKLENGKLVVPADVVDSTFTVATGECAAPEHQTILVVPAVSRAGVAAWIFPEDGRLEIRGTGPAQAVVWWRLGNAAWRSDLCAASSSAGDGRLVCALSVAPDDARAAFAGASVDILLLPPGSPAAAGSELPELWTHSSKAAMSLDSLRVPIQRFVLNGSIVHATSIEAWREQSVLTLSLPRILASVSCRPAGCWLSDDGSAVIIVPPSAGDAVTINARLSDRVWLRQDDGFVNSVTLSMPLARCQLRPLVGIVLGGTEDHRLPLALGDRCPVDLGGLAVETTPPSGAYVESVSSEGRRIDISLGHVPRRVSALDVRLVRGATRTIIVHR